MVDKGGASDIRTICDLFHKLQSEAAEEYHVAGMPTLCRVAHWWSLL